MVPSAKVFPVSSIALHTAMCLQLEGLALRGESSAVEPAAQASPGILRHALLLVLVMLAATWCARAQSTFGSIRGTVSDVSGAVIPGATVTAHSLEQNFDRQATTNDAGEFVVENLQPGHYSITVEHPGFSKAVVQSTQLDARQDLRIPVTLSVAANATTVEVSAEAAALNTENGTVSNTLAQQEATQLPMNSRAVSSSPLASLAISPSVVTDSQGNIAVGGATASQVGFSVDGISTANVRSNGALHDAYPSSEGISETKVTAFNNNAEFAQIGDVTFTTKSGTNQWHGSAFEYFQNAALDATIYDFTFKAPKNFNAFGGSLGGPVVLPKLGWVKDRTFFFLDYEGNRKTQSYPEELLVPTAAERAGDLSDLVNAPGQGAPVNNPFTGTAYANDTIPTISPVAQTLLSYYPLPNANGNGYNYQALAPIPSNTDGWDLRVDETLTSKQSVYARFSWKDLDLSEGGSGLTANQFLPNVTAHDQNRSLLASHNYVLRNNLVNEFRFGFTNFTEKDGFPIEGSAAITKLGLQGINISSHPTGDAFPTFSFSDGTFSNIGQDRVGTTISETMEFTDNVTWMHGKHSLKFGADARRVRYNALMFFQPSDDYGDFIFYPGLFTNYALGDLLLGLPQESFFAITSPQINAMSTQWGVYGQDEWQLSSRLTLNFGLRWELLPPFDESQGDLGSFDPKTNSVLVPDKFLKTGSTTATNNAAFQGVYTGFLDTFNACALGNTALQCSSVETASQDHIAQGLRQLYRGDFDPRVSIAYRPFNNDKTVIRAGVGIFTQTTLGPMSFNNAGNPTSNLLTNVNAVSGANGGLAVVQPAFQFPADRAIDNLGDAGRWESGAGERSALPRSTSCAVEPDSGASGDAEQCGARELRGHVELSAAGDDRPEPDSGEHDSVGHGCNGWRLCRQPGALSELDAADVVGEHRAGQLRGRDRGMGSSHESRAGAACELYVGEGHQRRAGQRRAVGVRRRGSVRGGDCEPVRSEIGPWQCGGDATASGADQRDVSAAFRRGACVERAARDERRARRLGHQHGDDDAVRAVADAVDQSGFRPVEYGYGGAFGRRSDSAAGLRLRQCL
jgi:hypothetical protein